MITADDSRRSISPTATQPARSATPEQSTQEASKHIASIRTTDADKRGSHENNRFANMHQSSLGVEVHSKVRIDFSGSNSPI